MGKGGESQQTEKKTKKITIEELAQHRTPKDGTFTTTNCLSPFVVVNVNFFISAWVAYQGKVYDVSNWEDHPGLV